MSDHASANKKRQIVDLSDPFARITQVLKHSTNGPVSADLARLGSHDDWLLRIRIESGPPPRHDYWAKFSTWEPHEAAAQLLGMDPDGLSLGAPQKRADLSSRTRDFIDLLRVVRRAIRAGDISRKRPTDYLAWAKGLYPIPEALAASVREFAKPQSADFRSGHQHRDATWLRVLIALVAKSFPGKNPFSTAGSIAGICDQHGLVVSEDTIRQLLKRAQELDIKPQ